jgi:hypothetical protein
MRSSSITLAIAFTLVFSVLNVIAGPPIFPKENRSEATKSVSSGQHSDIVQNHVELLTKEQAEPLIATPYQLFSMYDKRGPWRLSFLPQPPPQAKSRQIKN